MNVHKNSLSEDIEDISYYVVSVFLDNCSTLSTDIRMANLGKKLDITSKKIGVGRYLGV